MTVESLGGLGDGIARHQDRPVFIPKSCAGDRLNVRIVHENHQGLQGAIEEVLSPGRERITPPCQYFSQCGGCTLQHLSPESYQAFKTRMLRSALSQAGYAPGEAQVRFLPTASRRRVEFKIADARLAFHAQRSHNAVAVEQCIVLEPALQALITPLNEALAILPFTEHLKSVSLTAADSGIDLLFGLKSPVKIDAALMAELAERLGIARIVMRLPDESIRVLHSRSPVEMQLGPHRIALPPDAFLQATRLGQQYLTDAVLEATKDASAVVDLFCGIGTYSLPLSQRAKLHAAEGDTSMVKALQQINAPNLTAEKRDLLKHPLTASELNRFDAAVINPPRLGAKAQSEQLAQSKLATAVMVSCNPATFARDAKILAKAGFSLAYVFGIDQFLWTPHLEIVAVFKR